MYRYVAIGLIMLLVGFTTGWKTQGWRLGKEIATIRANTVKAAEKQATELQQLEAQYRERERQYVQMYAEAQEKRNVEIARINKRHAAVIDSLRQRPERKVPDSNHEVPGATPACTGTTGAELARGDAEFLAGYAADAARLDAELTKCEAAYNALRN